MPSLQFVTLSGPLPAPEAANVSAWGVASAPPNCRIDALVTLRLADQVGLAVGDQRAACEDQRAGIRQGIARAEAKRAGVDGGRAGVDVRARQRKRARAKLRQPARSVHAVGDRDGLAVGVEVQAARLEVHERVLEEVGVAGERRGADRPAGGAHEVVGGV